MLKLTLHELETFVAISQTGTMRTAGELLGLSQSAVSAALAELERRLNVVLFDRVGRGIVLNDDGRALLPRAIDVLQQVRDIQAEFGQTAHSNLSLASSQTIGNVLMPLLLQELLQQLPEIHVDLEIINSETVIQRVLDCQADFRLIEGPYSHPKLVFEPWLDDELVVYASKNNVLVHHSPDIQALAAEHWIVRESGSGIRRVLENALLPYLGNLNILLELGSSEAIHEAVRCGLGIACGSRRALERELARGEFVVLATPGIDLSRQFYLVWHGSRRLSAGAACLRQICQSLPQKTKNIVR